MVDTYVALDLETTGVNPKRDKIIEIGAVKVVEGKVVDVFSSFVNPGKKLGEDIIKLTGIEDDMLLEAPTPEEAVPQMIAFAEGFILLGHNIIFDYSFVKKAAVNLNMEFEKEGIDTLKIARKHLQHLESRKLDFLCRHFEIEHKAHRALEDASATSQLYLKMNALFDDEESFRPGRLVYKAKKEAPATKVQKERLYKLVDRHKIVMEDQIDRLTKSEASRITDQILAKFGR